MPLPHVAIDAATDLHSLTVVKTLSERDRLSFTTTGGATVELDRLAVAGLASDLALWLGGDR